MFKNQVQEQNEKKTIVTTTTTTPTLLLLLLLLATSLFSCQKTYTKTGSCELDSQRERRKETERDAHNLATALGILDLRLPELLAIHHMHIAMITSHGWSKTTTVHTPRSLPPSLFLCFVLVAVTFPEIEHKKKRSVAGVGGGGGGGEEDTRKHNRCGRAMRTTSKRDLKPTAQKLETSDKICTVFGGMLTQHRKNPRCISVFRFPNCPGSVLFLFFLPPAPPHPHAMPGGHPPDTLRVSQQMFSKEIF
jgi:hypothetical protein